MNGIDDDSPWDADPNSSYAHQSEWSKITSDFTIVRSNSVARLNLMFKQAGYREGITAGKNRPFKPVSMLVTLKSVSLSVERWDYYEGQPWPS